MQVGSIVELINDNWDNGVALMAKQYNITFPIKGTYYTIRGVNNYEAILLEEIVNPILFFKVGPFEPGFDIKRFKEVLPPQDLSLLLQESKEEMNEYAGEH